MFWSLVFPGLHRGSCGTRSRHGSVVKREERKEKWSEKTPETKWKGQRDPWGREKDKSGEGTKGEEGTSHLKIERWRRRSSRSSKREGNCSLCSAFTRWLQFTSHSILACTKENREEHNHKNTRKSYISRKTNTKATQTLVVSIRFSPMCCIPRNKPR